MKAGLILTVLALAFGAAAVWAVSAGKGKSEGPFVIRFPQADPSRLEPELPSAKARGIIFTGPATTLWGDVQTVHRMCVKAGVPQLEWAVAGQLLKISMPQPLKPGSEKVKLEDIVILLYRDHDATVRQVGTRKPVESDDDLARLILSMKIDYQRVGKKAIPVFIDADRDVPWGEIVRVMTLCRLVGFDDVHLEPPQRE